MNILYESKSSTQCAEKTHFKLSALWVKFPNAVFLNMLYLLCHCVTSIDVSCCDHVCYRKLLNITYTKYGINIVTSYVHIE